MGKEEVAEDFCFSCKDGGLLMVCDYGDCLKAYHANCVDKDPSFVETGQHWSCGWHSCFICKKNSEIQCYCCPKSVCCSCIKDSEIVQVKRKSKGFCNHCLKLATLIEENVDVDSDGEKVDFEDTETYEFLFKDYWEIVKEKEKICLEDLHNASASLKRGKHFTVESDSDKYSEDKDEVPIELVTENNFDEYLLYDESRGRNITPRMPCKRTQQKRKNFVGWGSEELIHFLTCIGKSTSEPLTQLDASDIIKSYIFENKLSHPDKKKKKVLCDEKLFSLFKKKSIKLVRIYNLLDCHFSGNVDSDDDFNFGLDEEEDLGHDKKKQRTRSGNKMHNSLRAEHASEPPQSCYASIIEENINLVYLRRSLVQDLMKNPEEFESKVVGSFVRVKIDRKDFFHTPDKIYQIGQVISTKKAQEAYKMGEINTYITLRVSNICKDVRISMLSEDDIEKGECEEFHLLIKKRLHKKITIAELEEKAASLHRDITAHQIKREIAILQKLIDRANEKGWRRELLDYLDRRELLLSPVEQERLLMEIPRVIPDTETVDDAIFSALPDTDGRNAESQEPLKISAEQTPLLNDTSRVSLDTKASLTSQVNNDNRSAENRGLVWEPVEERIIPDVEAVASGNPSPLLDSRGESEAYKVAFEANTAKDALRSHTVFSGNISERDLEEVEQSKSLEFKESNGVKSEGVNQIIEIDEDDDHSNTVKPADIQVICLEDDDDDIDVNISSKKAGETKFHGDSLADTGGYDKSTTERLTTHDNIGIDANCNSLWHYLDPAGNVQGPFALDLLRFWRAQGFFDDGFKVWRNGQTQAEAILLLDVLQLYN